MSFVYKAMVERKIQRRFLTLKAFNVNWFQVVLNLFDCKLFDFCQKTSGFRFMLTNARRLSLFLPLVFFAPIV